MYSLKIYKCFSLLFCLCLEYEFDRVIKYYVYVYKYIYMYFCRYIRYDYYNCLLLGFRCVFIFSEL